MAEVELTSKTVGGRYRVLDKLGEGAMGTVYLANDLELPRQVALKVLRRERASRPEVKSRIETECSLMAVLGTNTHIVTLYDRLEYEGDVIVVMEYVPGESLSDICDRTRTLNSDDESSRKTTPVAAGASVMVLEERDAVNVICQCLEGLDFAHSKGVVHRDIKPSNIMVMRSHNGNLTAKIMDFGVGKALPSDTNAFASPMLTAVGGPEPGTPAYMSPEQFVPTEFGPATGVSDLYSVGVTLYELLTLQRPFDGSYSDLLHAHTRVEPPDPRTLKGTVSPGVATVILRALRKSPKDRYQSAAEFKFDLEATQATRIPEPPFRGRNWLPPLFAGVAALLVMIAGGIYLLPGGTPEPPASSASVARPAAVVVQPQVPTPAQPAAELKFSCEPTFKAEYLEGEPFSVKVAVQGGADPSKVTVAASVPDGGSYNADTREFSWAGKPGLTGTKHVIFTIEDASVSPPAVFQEARNFKVQAKAETPPPVSPAAPGALSPAKPMPAVRIPTPPDTSEAGRGKPASRAAVPGGSSVPQSPPKKSLIDVHNNAVTQMNQNLNQLMQQQGMPQPRPPVQKPLDNLQKNVGR